MKESTEKFLQLLYTLPAQYQGTAIISEIYNLKDNDNFEAIIDIMENLDFKQLHTTFPIISALRICAVKESFFDTARRITRGNNAKKPRFSGYDTFLQRGKDRLQELGISDEEINDMLVGLINKEDR